AQRFDQGEKLLRCELRKRYDGNAGDEPLHALLDEVQTENRDRPLLIDRLCRCSAARIGTAPEIGEYLDFGGRRRCLVRIPSPLLERKRRRSSPAAPLERFHSRYPRLVQHAQHTEWLRKALQPLCRR